MMFDITGKRALFLIISEVIILIGIIALVVFGLQPGIEFSSGSIMTVNFEEEVEQAELEQELAIWAMTMSSFNALERAISLSEPAN